ncbi:hypothetical protein [Sphingomonas aerolata]|uniref:hypothetical protein n=1 Tax=Sphingomonas aerolata TaxID=185951 RepID=UPI002FDFC982
MITLHLPSCLDDHPREASLIGRLVLKYGELEWMLARVAACVNGDLDIVLKAMYRTRGELARLDIAEAFVGRRIKDAWISEIFSETFAAIDVCRKIRNSYAHAHWISGQEHQLGFYDLEHLAKSKTVVDLQSMRRSTFDIAVLSDQHRYFAEVLHNLVHVFYDLERPGTPLNDHGFISPIRPPRRAVVTPNPA